jgi:hypothetical protein
MMIPIRWRRGTSMRRWPLRAGWGVLNDIADGCEDNGLKVAIGAGTIATSLEGTDRKAQEEWRRP